MKKAIERLVQQRHILSVNYYLLKINNKFRALAAGKKDVKAIFASFLKKEHKDPWGGSLFLTSSHLIDTTTYHEPIFGLS